MPSASRIVASGTEPLCWPFPGSDASDTEGSERHLPAGARLVVGVDMVEIARVTATRVRYGERFLSRVFTPMERAATGERNTSLAARFAAKEATAKALGTGIGVVSWQMIEIESLPGGQPTLRLHAAAATHAHALGISEWQVSLSHTGTLAVAFVVGYRTVR